MSHFIKLRERGIAGRDITCEDVIMIGKGIAYYLLENEIHKPMVLIGMDTRGSSSVFMSALSKGINSIGVDVMQLGVIPTPAVAYLVGLYEADLGIMITASHNPAEYNGFKIFDKDGYVVSQKFNETVEHLIFNNKEKLIDESNNHIGKIYYANNAIEDYINHICNTISENLSGIKVAVDCANGCASLTVSKLLSRLGVDVVVLNSNPTGSNINDKCGCMHMECISDYVRKHKLSIGLAFDGDADRILVVDEFGHVIDGDELLSIFALNMLKENKLFRNTVVTTYMSNMGFGEFARITGLQIITTQIGENYVSEKMRKEGFSLGGEQSGHIIFSKYSTIGDGQLSAVQLLAIIKQRNESVSSLASCMQKYPQILLNVAVKETQKMSYKTDPEILSAISQAQKILSSNGRIMVRASSTEPMIRVMLEGKDSLQIKELGISICNTIKQCCNC